MGISEKRRIGRFASVGVANTAIDFLLYVGLSALGWPIFAANLVSTSAGLTFSFFARRSCSLSSLWSDSGWSSHSSSL
jgi:putative flippase GtrA